MQPKWRNASDNLARGTLACVIATAWEMFKSVFSLNARKHGLEKTPYFDILHAVCVAFMITLNMFNTWV